MNLESSVSLETLNALRCVLGLCFLWSILQHFLVYEKREYTDPFIQTLLALSVYEVGNLILAGTVWMARFGRAHSIDWFGSYIDGNYGTLGVTVGTFFLVVGYLCKIRVLSPANRGKMNVVVAALIAVIFILVTNFIWPLKS